jgi:uncharacterized protein (AIM24 family)
MRFLRETNNGSSFLEMIFDWFRVRATNDEHRAGQVFWNRFTGPGKIALQSMYLHAETAE